jgi:hypothetical protein
VITKLARLPLAQAIATESKLPLDTVKAVLEAFDSVADKALQLGAEVEVGSFGYLSLREPKNTKPAIGSGGVIRGKRVAFRERDGNRFRWK